MKIIIKDKRHLPTAVKKLLASSGGKKIFAFYGPMGAGKTTIIKAICKTLGVTGTMTSPSFTLVNEYKTTGGEVLYHIDFYRIKIQDEVFDIGIEEYFSGGSYCFLEWPEVVEDIIPPGTLKIRITVDKNEQRVLALS
ncbi:MAG TPA: tRNA (adenosine(37)-N6)-threonylcarbamoyltransferase complex ATPase subunit type 1 TsaE [Bacteroidales bacterium]|nr:tRNA (adenosine(37)-N6)-threonylcarbamoyltransferase complex ATPase subunit type 1 TsaE [Bacteroidales bacterium]